MMEGNKKVREPLFHVVKREGNNVFKSVGIYAVAIAVALLLTSEFCALTSKSVKDPTLMFVSMYKGVFATPKKTWTFIRDVMLLLGVSLALLPAFKMKFWNLGANGQVLIACLVAFGIMRWGVKGNLSRGVVIPLMIVACIGSGVVWAVIPAVFKAFFKTNESLFTLMMNYIAAGLVAVMTTIWEPKGSGNLKRIKNYAFIDIGGNAYWLTIIVIAVVAVVMYFYLTRSKHGYELSLVGESENSARYAGVNVKLVTIRTLMLSGAICGVVGLIITGGINYTVSQTIHSNMGFTAIMTTWLANFNPIVTIFTCILITFVSSGMAQVKRDFGFTNDAIANVALGIIYFFIIACHFFINYRIVFRGHKSEEKVGVIKSNEAARDNKTDKVVGENGEKGGNA